MSDETRPADTFRRVYVQHIHLAASEWGIRTMDRVAREHLELRGLPNAGADGPRIVYVHEHAGWFLAYAMVDGKIQVVASANGAASYNNEVAEFRRRAFHAPWVYLPEVRRNDVPAEARAAAPPDVARNT